jgi:hypothetical protein
MKRNDSFEASWWLHIVGILIFMNYCIFQNTSILLAFQTPILRI